MNPSLTGPSGHGRGWRLRRRAPVASVCIAIAVVASALGPTAGAAAPARQVQVVRAGERSIAPGKLGGPFTAASVVSAEEVLARSGVATVADERSKVPLVSV